MTPTLKLGSLVLRSTALLSPLESVSDVGFRHLCGSLGAGLTWTEMIRVQAICRNNKSALDLVDTIDASTPTGIQLLAKTPKDLESALLNLEHLAGTGRPHFSNLVAVDCNFGCPSPAIIREGAGPALLKRRARLGELFQVLHDWKRSTSLKSIGAVGCKIRLGLTRAEACEHKVYLTVAELAASVGLDYITVHARHAEQRSSEAAQWYAIREVKELCMQQQRPGGGELGDDEDPQGSAGIKAVHRMMHVTGCDGVMVARGAIRNPWIFRGILSSSSSRNSNSETTRGTNTLRSGDGAVASVQEVATARDGYLRWAALAETKPKFVDFHRENFARLAAAASKGVSGCAIEGRFPTNNHMGAARSARGKGTRVRSGSAKKGPHKHSGTPR